MTTFPAYKTIPFRDVPIEGQFLHLDEIDNWLWNYTKKDNVEAWAWRWGMTVQTSFHPDTPVEVEV